MTTVVVPFVHGMLNPETARVVSYSGHWHRLVDIDPNDHGAYGRLFRQLWRSAVSFVICEHDVVPTQEQLDEIVHCRHDWCSYGYDDGLYGPGPMFGLCRFSSSIMRAHPLAAEVATMVSRELGIERSWHDLDSHVARDLGIRGVEWHEHNPPVHHVHLGPATVPPPVAKYRGR